MNCNDFVNNSIVKNFIEQVVTKNFPKRFAPKWIDYELFCKTIIKKASENLYTDISNDTCYWWTEMLFPYMANDVDDSSSVMCNVYEQYDDYSPVIPEEIINLIRT
jgi:hypothetical protein